MSKQKWVNGLHTTGGKVIVLISMAALNAGCDVTPFANANADCKQELRDNMRDPRGVSIRYIDRTESSPTSMRIRYRVRGENGFGAVTEEVRWCQWEQTVQRDDGSYRYRIFTGRERR